MTMNKNDLTQVELLCSDVMKLIVEVNREIRVQDEEWNKTHPDHISKYQSTAYGSVNTGALRRRSMDLTRALAQLRKT